MFELKSKKETHICFVFLSCQKSITTSKKCYTVLNSMEKNFWSTGNIFEDVVKISLCVANIERAVYVIVF